MWHGNLTERGSSGRPALSNLSKPSSMIFSSIFSSVRILLDSGLKDIYYSSHGGFDKSYLVLSNLGSVLVGSWMFHTLNRSGMIAVVLQNLFMHMYQRLK